MNLFLAELGQAVAPGARGMCWWTMRAGITAGSRRHLPASAREVVEWAVREGKLALPRIDPLDALAGQMASALREEYATDANGNRYRVNHAIRVTSNGVQMTFWGIMGFAPRRHIGNGLHSAPRADCQRLRAATD
jgi:hypothetical protein